jgi:hypothetical protein
LSDRRNRRILILIGLLLFLGGGLACCLGAGVFGTVRSNRPVFDPTVVRWWNEGGWKSFATLVAIGAVLAVIGIVFMVAQLHRNDGRSRVRDFAYPSFDGDRGETSIRAAALSHGLEADLIRIPNVHRAMVGLFGAYPAVEMRAVLDVGDDADLEALPTRVEQALANLKTTAGVRPDPVQVTIRFTAARAEREIV